MSKEGFDSTEQLDISKVTEKDKTYEHAEQLNKETRKKNHDKNGKKHKKKLNPKFVWSILLVTAIIFFIVFFSLPMFPFRWKLILGIILVVLLAVTGYFSFRKNGSKKVIKIVNVLLSLIVIIVSVMLPIYVARISSLINDQEVDNTIKMNLYVVTDEYKAAHPDVFTDTEDTTESSFSNEKEELLSYANSTLITEITLDTANQKEALDQLYTLLGNENLSLSDAESVTAAADQLYSNQGQFLLMGKDYESILEATEGYEDFAENTRVIYTIKLETDATITVSDTSVTTEPWTIFIGGNDEEGELSLVGKTDVDIVVTVNPVTYQIAIVSFPRDSYIPNPALSYQPDKLTHLGMSGLQNTLTGLGNVLSTNIDNYFMINFTTYKQIIDAIGGVDVDNPYEFGFWDNPDIDFPEGNIHLDGENALLYVRERKTLPDGDFGRNMHQQLVLRAIIDKLTSPAMIVKFDSLISAMKGTFLTSLTDDQIYSLCEMQLSKNIHWNIVNYRIEGGVGYAVCASATSMELSVVFPYANQIEFASSVIQSVINGETVTQEEMPEGYGYYSDPITLQEETYDYSYDTETDNSYILETAAPAPVDTPVPEETSESTEGAAVDQNVIEEPTEAEGEVAVQ